MVTFWDLPDALRRQIYEIVIFDHDRTAVFLPRALPRKVISGVDDVDVECVGFHGPFTNYGTQEPASHRPQHMPCVVRSIYGDNSPSHGIWQEDFSVVNGALDVLQLPLNVAQQLRDDEVLMLIEGDSDDESDDGHVRGANKSAVVGMSEELMEKLDAVGSEVDSGASSPISHPESPIDQDGESELKDEDNTGEESAKAAEADNDDPEICHWNARGYCDAHVACTDGADHSVFTLGEHIDNDDEAHFDTAEEIGMLYELREPSILLVSKAIRSQSLPLYYSRNAFSWRFDWTNYHRACGRFRSWVKSIDVSNVALLTKISFQGRHMIEEGFEFSADVEILAEHPFFEMSVHAADDETIADVEIVQAIDRELTAYLCLMAQCTESRPALSAGHLCELASIFVQGMHRDAGNVTHENALPLRMALRPLF